MLERLSLLTMRLLRPKKEVQCRIAMELRHFTLCSRPIADNSNYKVAFVSRQSNDHPTIELRYSLHFPFHLRCLDFQNFERKSPIVRKLP
jgi:hypothetical protein